MKSTADEQIGIKYAEMDQLIEALGKRAATMRNLTDELEFAWRTMQQSVNGEMISAFLMSSSWWLQKFRSQIEIIDAISGILSENEENSKQIDGATVSRLLAGSGKTSASALNNSSGAGSL